MPGRITFTVTEGPLLGQEFAFVEPTVRFLGRSSDCYPQLPNDFVHRNVSRHHCLLEIDPPHIRVRDFGSLNGTFVNEENIGSRNMVSGDPNCLADFPACELMNGDELRVGNTVFLVRVTDPAPEAETETSDGDDGAEPTDAGTGDPQSLLEGIQRLLRRRSQGLAART